jgi:hypothetical protein
MRNFTLFIYIVLFGIITNPTKAQSWGQIGSEWFYCIPEGGVAPLYDYEKFWIEKDTLIQNKNCFLIKSNKDSSLIFYFEDEKVYLYLLDSFNLIYNYEVDLGDTVQFSIPARTKNSYQIDTLVKISAKLQDVGFTYFNEDSLKYFNFSYDTLPGLDYLITGDKYIYHERIGYSKEFYYNFQHPTIDPVTDLRCYHDADYNIMTEWYSQFEVDCDFAYRISISDIYNPKNNFIIKPSITSNSFELSIEDNYDVYQIIIVDLVGKIYLNEVVTHNINFGDNFISGVYFLHCYNISNNKLEFKTKIVKI